MSELQTWSWFFLVVYVGVMLGFGALGMRRVKGADDFATARGGYGPLFLAVAFTATASSGATFLGLPAWGYQVGVSSLALAILYPLGTYIGVLICLRVISHGGSEFGSRSIPEYLGDRYQSEFLRVACSVFTLLMLFYLAGQLVSGLVMFERMLGLSEGWALAITAIVLVLYITLGGAHADILTDGIQGVVMLAISLGIVGLTLYGYSAGGSFEAVLERATALDPHMADAQYPGNPIFGSNWNWVALFICHIPLGLLPHVGNKLWALNDSGSQRTFITAAFTMGMLLPLVTVGGILARAVLGDALFADGSTPNEAIPALLIEIFPAWFAALLSVAILSAIMSTADGLVVSTSQIFANDLYRRTLAPRWHPDDAPERIERRVLLISRVASVFVMLAACYLALQMLTTNVVIVIWIGLGGTMAATAGPVILGALWKSVTRLGALWGFGAGAVAFLVLKMAWLPELSGTPLAGGAQWLLAQAPNPFSCSTLGILFGMTTTWLVSLATPALPSEHLDRVFGQ